jgi:hypothetical protein
VVSIYSGSTTYASVTVPTSGQAAGAFNYVSLSTPVILPAGTYYCESAEVSGGDQWYNFDTTVNTSGTVATFEGASVGGTENKMGYIYVPVNFEYLK